MFCLYLETDCMSPLWKPARSSFEERAGFLANNQDGRDAQKLFAFASSQVQQTVHSNLIYNTTKFSVVSVVGAKKAFHPNKLQAAVQPRVTMFPSLLR